MTDPLEHAARLTRPEVAPPSLPDLHRARTPRAATPDRKRWLWIGSGAAAGLAAVFLAFILIPRATDDPMRTRGVTVAPDLRVEVAVVDPTGVTARLPGDGSVEKTDQLVFRVHTDMPGQLQILEQRGASRTSVYEATIPTGTTIPGGDTPLGWTTDLGAGPATYHVQLCPEGGGPCARTNLEVRWR